VKLIAEWGVHSPRLDRLLAAGCSHCGGSHGRLVRHNARAGGTKVWLACCSCNARLGGALGHGGHPRRASYPLWSKDLSEAPGPEEVEEIVLAAKPISLVELLRRAGCNSRHASRWVAALQEALRWKVSA
jgi:hypothetical protein